MGILKRLLTEEPENFADVIKEYLNTYKPTTYEALGEIAKIYGELNYKEDLINAILEVSASN